MLYWDIHKCVYHNFQTCSAVTLRNVTVVLSRLVVGVDAVVVIPDTVVDSLVCGVSDKVEVVPSLLAMGVDAVVIPDAVVDLLVCGVSDKVEVVPSLLAMGVDAVVIPDAVVDSLVCGVSDKVEVVPSLLAMGIDAVVIPDAVVDSLVCGVSDKVEDTDVVVVGKETVLLIKTWPNVKPTA